MQIKNIVLTATLMLSAISCQAIVGNIIVHGVILSVPFYAGYQYGQANGDVKKSQRLLRKDKDVVITKTLDILYNVCPQDGCKKLRQLLAQAISSEAQIKQDQKDIELEILNNIKASINSKNALIIQAEIARALQAKMAEVTSFATAIKVNEQKDLEVFCGIDNDRRD